MPTIFLQVCTATKKKRTCLIYVCTYRYVHTHLLRRILSCLRERERRAMTICPEANLGFCALVKVGFPGRYVIVYVWHRAARICMYMKTYCQTYAHDEGQLSLRRQLAAGRCCYLGSARWRCSLQCQVRTCCWAIHQRALLSDRVHFCSWPRETQREKHTHTDTHAHTHTHTHTHTLQVAVLLVGMLRGGLG